MTAVEFGHAAILMSLLVSVGGIVAPSSAAAAVAALFTVVGFALYVSQSHHDWESGYTAGRGSSEVRRVTTIVTPSSDAVRPDGVETLFKCGLDGCYCVKDSRFKEWAQ